LGTGLACSTLADLLTPAKRCWTTIGEARMSGARVTDEVMFWRDRGQLRKALRAVRTRKPERLRWRAALSTLTASAGSLRGFHRSLIEEPVREIVLDLDDRMLRREAVIDARRFGVDLDRGEVLPTCTRWDLKRTAFLTGVDHELLGRYLRLPSDFGQPMDTAGVVLGSRAIAGTYKLRAESLTSRVPSETETPLARYQELLAQRARHERELARRWSALSKALLAGSR
jgi:hypothetical protein